MPLVFPGSEQSVAGNKLDLVVPAMQRLARETMTGGHSAASQASFSRSAEHSVFGSMLLFIISAQFQRAD